MITYKLFNDIETKQTTAVFKLDGIVICGIPFDPANTDYQEYLKWLAKGNKPLPADEGEQ